MVKTYVLREISSTAIRDLNLARRLVIGLDLVAVSLNFTIQTPVIVTKRSETDICLQSPSGK